MSRNRGYLHAIVAAALFGASIPFSKSLLSDMNPWVLAGTLYLGAGIGLFLLVVWRGLSSASTKEARLGLKDWQGMVGATVFGGVLGPVFLMYGLVQTPATSASLYLNLEGVFTALIAWTIFREHFDRRILAGMAFIVLGGTVLSWTSHFEIRGALGPSLIAAACLSWGIDNNFTRRISASDPVQIAMVKCLVAGLINLALSRVIGASVPSGQLLLIGSVLGFLSYGVSLMFFVLALRSVGTSRTGAYFSMAPFMGAGLSILFLGEPVTSKLILAFALMGFGVWLHLTERHEHEHEHAESTHEHRHVHDEHHQHIHGPSDPAGEPHTHRHRHESLRHSHSHFPDMDHRHRH